MNVDVKNIRNEKVGEIDLPDELIDRAVINVPLMQQAVKVYLANQRQGNACTKTRAEVSGSGRKLWKQKHTGRARVGSIRTPLWRHGGTVFGPRPHDFRLDFPKRMRRAALRSAVASKFNDGKFLILDEITLPDARTRSAAGVFKGLGVRSALVLDTADNAQLRRSLQNLGKFRFFGDNSIHVYDILKHDQLVVTMRALNSFIEALQ